MAAAALPSRVPTDGARRWQVELTSARYPHLKRGPYGRLTDGDLAHFRRLLGEERVLTDDLAGYNTDWMRSVRGKQRRRRPRETERADPTRCCGCTAFIVAAGWRTSGYRSHGGLLYGDLNG